MQELKQLMALHGGVFHNYYHRNTGVYGGVALHALCPLVWLPCCWQRDGFLGLMFASLRLAVQAVL